MRHPRPGQGGRGGMLGRPGYDREKAGAFFVGRGGDGRTFQGGGVKVVENLWNGGKGEGGSLGSGTHKTKGEKAGT